MKVINIKFSNLYKNIDLRLDFGLRYVEEILNFNPLNLTNFIHLGDVLDEISTEIIRKGDLEEEYQLLELSNIYKKFNIVENLETVTNINSDKILLGKGDFIISKMTPRLGTMYLNLNNVEYLGSTELIEFKIKEWYNSEFLFYLLSTDAYLDVLEYLESGKNQRRIKTQDLLKLKIPMPTHDLLLSLNEKVRKLSVKLTRRESLSDIIDDSFKKTTGIILFDSKNSFITKLHNLGQDFFSRFSFHNQNYFNVLQHEKISGDKWQFIEDVFDISGGKRIPKGQSFVNAETPYFYLRPSEVSLTGVDRENIPNISESTYNVIKRYTINTGEFCVSNVGTLGKVGLIDLNELDIPSDRLLLSENFVKLTAKNEINKNFYFYYFNSYLFKKQIDREYTVTSIMKLGLDKIKKIKVPKFAEEVECEIVVNIQQAIEGQIKNLKEIEEDRKEITLFIENQNY